MTDDEFYARLNDLQSQISRSVGEPLPSHADLDRVDEEVQELMADESTKADRDRLATARAVGEALFRVGLVCGWRSRSAG